MKVILKKDVEKLGVRGDVVDVADGYARNFLFPRGLAEKATKGKIKEIEILEQQQEKEENQRVNEARDMAEKLEDIKLVFPVKAGEEGRLFGSITNQDIAEKLAKKGFEIDRRNIELEDNIKELGEHEVDIKIYQDVYAKITVEVEEKS